MAQIAFDTGKIISTYDEAFRLKEYIKNSKTPIRSVIVVSDPFHMCRLRFEARRMDLTPYSSPTTTSPISGSSRRELGYFATEALKMPVSWVRSW